MPCYHPLTLYQSKNGPNPKTGKWALTGLPFGLPEKPVPVPCGRCIGCRLERSRQWAVRCVHEAQMHQQNCFITLTYRNDALTYGDERPTLYPRDLQLFLKKLRKKYEPTIIRFFACGEYGGLTNRPHYHACIFGFDFQDKKFHSTKMDNHLYTSNTLNNIWGHGNCLIGNVTFESAAYVARYIMDKKMGETAKYYVEQSITPEFVRMSRRPGIGKSWFDKYHTDIFPADRVVIRNNTICTPPKYYSGQFEILNPVKYSLIKNNRKNNILKNYENYTSEKLLIREQIKLAQIKNISRQN